MVPRRFCSNAQIKYQGLPARMASATYARHGKSEGQDLVAASADGLGGAWLVGQGGTACTDGQQP